MGSARNMRRQAAKETTWTQRHEGRVAILEIRIPNNPAAPMPVAHYVGKAASERLQRFCIGFLRGLRDGTSDPVIDVLLEGFHLDGQEEN